MTIIDPATGDRYELSDFHRRCLLCEDTGFIEVDPSGHGTVKPCHRCRPGSYDRWAAGHFAVNHWCESCGGRRP